DRPGDAQEELEQELAADGLVPRRDREPAPQLGAPLVGERVDVAIWLPALRLAPALGEALGGQPVQDRVDLAVALVPEVGDRALDQLLDVIAGHRTEAQHAEDRVPARIRPRRCHRALRRPIPRLTTLTAKSPAPV